MENTAARTLRALLNKCIAASIFHSALLPHTHPALNAEPSGDFPGDFTESPGADMTSCTPRYVKFPACCGPWIRLRGTTRPSWPRKRGQSAKALIRASAASPPRQIFAREQLSATRGMCVACNEQEGASARAPRQLPAEASSTSRRAAPDLRAKTVLGAAQRRRACAGGPGTCCRQSLGYCRRGVPRAGAMRASGCRPHPAEARAPPPILRPRVYSDFTS